jgi:hypothetical protein
MASVLRQALQCCRTHFFTMSQLRFVTGQGGQINRHAAYDTRPIGKRTQDVCSVVATKAGVECEKTPVKITFFQGGQGCGKLGLCAAARPTSTIRRILAA